jgi:hypothetical protein
LSYKRARIDHQFTNHKEQRTVILNDVASCLKEIIRCNNFSDEIAENIKEEWFEWMTKHSGFDDNKCEYMWDDAKPSVWSSQQLLKWARKDSADYIKFVQKHPELQIIDSKLDELEMKLDNHNGPDKRFILERYNEDHIRDLDLLKYATILVKGGMNSRKSVKSTNCLVKNRIMNAVFVCHRISSGQDTTGRLRRQLQMEFTRENLEQVLEAWEGDDKPVIVFYKDLMLGEKIPDNCWLIIQVESLGKLIKDFKKPDVLVLDEVTSLLSQLFSKTMKRKETVHDVIDVFEMLLKETPHVIALCADMDERTLYVMRKLRQGYINLQINERTIGNRLKCHEYINKYTMLSRVTEMVLNEHKNIFISCMYKSEAYNLQRFFIHK